MEHTRRQFIQIALAAGGFVGAAVKSDAASPKRMRLSLSVRVAEPFFSKETSTKTIDELIALAKSNEYEAICMRGSQAGLQSSAERVREISGKLRAAGLPVSMVTGDFAIPSNNDEAPQCLRKITPYLDLAEAFGADLIRIAMKKDEDISWAQRAADEARERRIRLAHQSHLSSLFETVDGSLRVLKAVGRRNFGIIYEPANWFVAGQNYTAVTIRRLQPFIFNVYVQNHRLSPTGQATLQTWTRGPVKVDHIGIWEKGGVNFEEVFGALDAIRYRGYVTVHQAFGDVMPVDDAVRRSAEYLKTKMQDRQGR